MPVRRGPGKDGIPVTVRAMAQLAFKELEKLMVSPESRQAPLAMDLHSTLTDRFYSSLASRG